MDRYTTSFFLLFLLLAALLPAGCSAAEKAAKDFPFAMNVDTPSEGLAKALSGVSLLSNGKPVLRYRFNDVVYKPYAEFLYTPAGVNILRDSPFDHKHHHSLMYAIKINGVNFWEEYNEPGLQKHEKFSRFDRDTCLKKEILAAGFTEQLTWHHPKANKLLAHESRSIAALKPTGLDASFVMWQTELRPPEGVDALTLTGAHYHGLGMRFLTSMDTDGEFRNSENKQGTVFRGTERLLKANWCAYTAKADGKVVTVAMFSHPRNPRHPTRWFIMNAPFAYLSATMTLHENPYTVKAGTPFVVRYGIAVWDGRPETEAIEALYQRWITW